MLDDGYNIPIQFLDLDSSGILREVNLEGGHCEILPILGQRVDLVAVAALTLVTREH